MEIPLPATTARPSGNNAAADNTCFEALHLWTAAPVAASTKAAVPVLPTTSTREPEGAAATAATEPSTAAKTPQRSSERAVSNDLTSPDVEPRYKIFSEPSCIVGIISKNDIMRLCETKAVCDQAQMQTQQERPTCLLQSMHEYIVLLGCIPLAPFRAWVMSARSFCWAALKILTRPSPVAIAKSDASTLN